MLARRRLRAEESRLAREADGLIEFVGLGHRRGEPAGGLPYGEQRLVELAGALAARPRVLLLGEPRAGMTTAGKGTGREPICPVPGRGATGPLLGGGMR